MLYVDKERAKLLYEALDVYKKDKDANGDLTLVELATIEGLQTVIYMEGQKEDTPCHA